MPDVWKRELRWSTPVEDVVRRVVAEQGVACWFEPKGLVKRRPRVARMGVRDAKGGDLVAAGLGQLMANLYESRSV